MPQSFDCKVNNASVTHYRLGKHHPMEFYEWAVFVTSSWKKTALGTYTTSEPYWIAQPLQFVHFKANTTRQPALLIKGVEYKGLGQPYFAVVATPPFKKKTKFKELGDLLSYVPMTDVLSFSKTVPQSAKGDLPGLVKHLPQFSQFNLKTVDEVAGYLTMPVSERWAMVDEVHDNREKAIFFNKGILGDTAAKQSMQASYENHLTTMRTHVLKETNKAVYDTPYPDRISLVEARGRTFAEAEAEAAKNKCVAAPDDAPLSVEAATLEVQAKAIDFATAAASKPEVPVASAEVAADVVEMTCEVAGDETTNEATEKATKKAVSKLQKRKRRGDLAVESQNLVPKHTKRQSRKVVKDFTVNKEDKEEDKEEAELPDKASKPTKKADKAKESDDGKVRRQRKSGLTYNTVAKKNQKALEVLMKTLEGKAEGEPVDCAELLKDLKDGNADEIAKVGLGKVTSTSFGEGSALVNDLRDRLEKKTEELNQLRNEFAEYKMDMAEKLAGQYRQAVKDLNGLPASPKTAKSD